MRLFSATLVALAIVGAACGGASGGAGGAASGGTGEVVAMTMTDKDITVDKPSVAAGKVTFRIKNTGTVVHSMVVIKTSLDEAKLPADPKDPGKVDERGSVGSSGQIDKGASKDVTLDLTSGRYVIVCNEPAHYIIGMHVAFTVK